MCLWALLVTVVHLARAERLLQKAKSESTKALGAFTPKGSTNKIQNSYRLSLSTYSKGVDGTKKSNSFATARVQFIKRDFPGGSA